MSTFFTADNHFGHDNIRVYCNRPFDTVEEMDAEMVIRWNSVVGPRDNIYILGDFAWGDAGPYLKQLNGRKILIMGNHDEGPLDDFTLVYDLLDIKLDKQRLVLCHYKIQVWNRWGNGAWHLYGHSHGTQEEMPNVASCDVGVDVWDFFPVAWEDIQFKLKQRHLQHGMPGAAEQRRQALRKENRAMMWRAHEREV